MKINEKIFKHRRMKGLSQEDLASAIGVSRQSISKWETGESMPETGKLKLLADCLGIDVDYLLSEDDVKNNGYEKDGLVSLIKGAVNRYGWLFGARMAIVGAITIIGGVLFTVHHYHQYHSILKDLGIEQSFFSMDNFSYILFFIIFLGVVELVLGIFLAKYLKNKENNL